MNYLVIILRLVHIVSGVFWVGGGIVSTFYLLPASAATGEAGQKFMGYLMRQARLTSRMMSAAGLTVLAGAWLYWIDSSGLTSRWMRTGPGWGFGIGALFAILGLLLGGQVGRIARKLTSLGSASQGTPTQAQVLELEATQRQMQRLSVVSTVCLIIALALMAIARYLTF